MALNEFTYHCQTNNQTVAFREARLSLLDALKNVGMHPELAEEFVYTALAALLKKYGVDEHSTFNSLEWQEGQEWQRTMEKRAAIEAEGDCRE